MKQKTFEKILFQNFMYLILITALLISIFCAVIDAHNTLSNEKKNMYDSLLQAQININSQTQMIEDYLTLVHSNSALQDKLKQLNYPNNSSLLTDINDELFAVDLFKKALDSTQIFVSDSSGKLPAFSHANYHSNALFSADSVSSSQWFQDTMDAAGATVWFIDSKHFSSPTVCAARVLYNLDNMPQRLGVLRANVSLDKLTQYLKSLSFGDKGYSVILADGVPLDTYNKLPDNITEFLKSPDSTSNFSHLIVRFPVVTKNWEIVGIIKNIELYRSTMQNLVSIVLISCIAILFSSIFSRKLQFRISHPITLLCNNMHSMSVASYQYDVNCIEIKQLYNTYNEMLLKNEMLIHSREEAIIKYKRAEMIALQSQMNPHFIYNTLESINALIAIGDNKHASLMTTELGSFLRSALNNGNNLIPLEKELAQVHAYFQIQKLRYSNKIEFILDVPEPLPDYKIIKLILQPLVENSIIHGFKDMEETGVIRLSVRENTDSLILSVADNGFGTDIEMLNDLVVQKTLYKEDNVNFYSIQNIKQRLSNYYGNNSSLIYKENTDGGVTAVIQIKKTALQEQKER